MKRALGIAALVATASGCTDLSRFSNDASDSYCGSITLAGSFRSGFSPRVQMRLWIDATKLDGSTSPGKLATFEASDGMTKPTRLLDDADLIPITAMQNDPLSRLEFGEGRERNAIFSVLPSATDVDPILAFVSLKTDETVEVRLVRAGLPATTEPPPEPGKRALFGIFPLTRQPGTCGF